MLYEVITLFGDVTGGEVRLENRHGGLHGFGAQDHLGEEELHPPEAVADLSNPRSYNFV